MRICLIFFLIVISFSLSGQKGAITGYIFDQESQEPLPGATIAVTQTNMGIAANEFGKFKIPGVEPGKYELQIRFIGFSKISKEIEVKKGENTSLDIPMTPSVVDLGDIEITPGFRDNNAAISQLEIKLKPITSSQDVLKIVPGLFIAQHAGGGKAEQIFLRGFDIDHGTDISLKVDGLPINMVSHAHGQGYSDLHFIIPETIQKVDFDKGPYYADKGNFNTAGFAHFRTKRRLSDNTVKLEGGQFGRFRGVGLFNLLSKGEILKPSLFLATEFTRSDGYFESSQNFHRFNGLLKFHQQINPNQILEISGSVFNSNWDAFGQIPERAVKHGLISRFGAIDDTEGGRTNRYNLNGRLSSTLSNGGILESQLYYSFYDFSLVSNFTFFLNDPIDGDQITQSESRNIYGLNTRYWNDRDILGISGSTEFGLEIRHDEINDVRLSRTKNKNQILSDLAYGDINESNISFFVVRTLELNKKIHLISGFRYDHLFFHYQDQLQSNPEKAYQNQGILSPKLQLSYQLNEQLKFYLKSGTGFHSNDSRVVIEQRGSEILPKAYGVDLGARWKVSDHILINAALWRLDLDQEFVYVGDEGIVEQGGRTRRQGIDLGIRYQIAPWLFANMDLNLTKARSIDSFEGQNFIPLAPSFTSIGGLSFQTKKGLSGSLSYRFIDDRAANEDYSTVARGYFLLDAVVNYQIGSFQIGLSIENLLNQEWNEAQFETESRLFAELESVSEIHFTPGTPLQGRLSFAWKF